MTNSLPYLNRAGAAAVEATLDNPCQASREKGFFLP